jgi:hypothetical protein
MSKIKSRYQSSGIDSIGQESGILDGQYCDIRIINKLQRRATIQRPHP